MIKINFDEWGKKQCYRVSQAEGEVKFKMVLGREQLQEISPTLMPPCQFELTFSPPPHSALLFH